MFNWRKYYAIKQKYDEEFSWVPCESGIYLWYREEGKTTYFYVGQARNLHKRRFDYYLLQTGVSYPQRHFEASLKKHKDWHFKILETCKEEELNDREKHWIDHYLSLPNHITRNDLIANQDIVRSNAKRIHNVYNKTKKELAKLLNRVAITSSCNIITITPKVKADGKSYTKLSIDALNEIDNWIKEITNGKTN